jgi:hypothetical protein
LTLLSNIKYPSPFSQIGETPPSYGDYDVEDYWDEEEVSWENKLMVEEMGYNS